MVYGSIRRKPGSSIAVRVDTVLPFWAISLRAAAAMCAGKVSWPYGTKSVRRRGVHAVAAWSKLLPNSTRCYGAGSTTSNTRDFLSFGQSMALSVVGCGHSCVNGRNAPVLVDHARTSSAGRMPSSLHMDCSACLKPMCRRANPDEETTNRRAVCGRTACTVRRAGRARALSDPYHWLTQRATDDLPPIDLVSRAEDMLRSW